jgi:DUF1009 family protein
LTLNRGNYTKLKPSLLDAKSIIKGISFFKKSNKLDHVQAIVIKDSKIIAKENKAGTKKMLSRLKKRSNSILMKFPKNKQDLRIDLPTIGIQTLKDCKKFGLKGIVLKSKQNIFLNKDECIKFANRNKIFISII